MRISFFPFTPEVEGLVRNISVLNSFEIFSIISFKEDMVKLKSYQDNTGIFCTTSVEKGLQQTDCLVLLPKCLEPQWDKYYDCINYATQHNITIYGGQELVNRLPEEGYRNFANLLHNDVTLTSKIEDDKLLDANIPIIAVLGLGGNCGKFECELELKRYIDSLGYQCLALASNPLGSFVDMELLPDFLYDNSFSLPEKILRFNRYVHTLCVKRNPDVLLVSVPGGIIPLSETEANYFSEIPLIISMALHIDLGILAVYFNTERKSLNKLVQLCQQRYSVSIKAFYLSRQATILDPETEKMQFMFLSDKYISNHSNEGDDCYIATPLKDNSNVYKFIIQALQENIETV